MKMIFVSSTFKDMHYERDIIHERVAPELNEYALQYGDSVSFCDLRWGVNTGELENEEGSKKVLSVCLDEIDKCRPYMIIIIGERYGWIPDQKLISEALEHRNDVALEELEISVTALEIEYGALCHPDKMQNTLIYFREFEGEIPDNYKREGEAHARKLEKLKERVKKLTDGKVKTYKVHWDETTQSLQGVDDFATMVSQDVKKLLTEEWNEYQQLDPHEKDQKIQWEYASQKAKQFSARESYVNQYMDKLKASQNLLILKGASGSGKSTLMSRLAQRLQEECEVCLLFSGNTAHSSNVLDVLKSMVHFVESKLGWSHFEDEIHSHGTEQKKEIMKESSEGLLWADRLNEVITAYENQADKRIVFLLDAVDQLYADELREKRYYIPSNLCEKVQMVISCLDDFDLPYEEEVQWILPLSEQDKREIIKGITNYIRRELEQCVVDKIVKKQSSDNPLYLSMLIQRLVMMNKSDFEDIVTHGDGMSAISEHQMKLVEEVSDTLQGVGVDILKAASERVGGRFVQKAAMYIALSRYGLREKDLENILMAEGLPWNTLDFSIFVKYMRSLFLIREDGRLDFAHKNIREGYRAICDEPKKMHHQIMKHLDTLDEKDAIRINEIIYHCMKADEKEYFIQYMDRYENTEELAVAAAAVVKQECLEDDGRWLLQVMEMEKTDSEHIGMFNFLNYELDDAFDITQKELQIEIALYQVMIKKAEEQQTELKKAENQQSAIKQCRRLAMAYRNLAALYDCLDDHSSRELARHYYKMALKIRKEIRSYEETTIADLRQLSNAYDALAAHYTYEEDKESLETGRTLYLEAYKIRKELLNQEQSMLHRANLAKSYKNLGKVCSYYDTASDDRQALIYYNQAEELYEQLIREKDSYRSNLASIYRYKALVYENMGSQEDLENALIFYKKNVMLRERLNMEQGSSASRKNLVTAYSDIADFMSNYGSASDLKEAEKLYKKILEIAILLHKERNTASSYSFLARCYYDLGNCYSAQDGTKNQKMAQEMLEHVLKIRQELDQTQKTDDSLMDLILVRKKLAFSLLKTGKESDQDQAIAFISQNVLDWEKLSQKHKTRKSQLSLATTYLNYTRIVNRNDYPEEMEHTLKKALHIYESYSEEELTSSDIQNYSSCNQDLANYYIFQNTKESLQKALTCVKKSDQICERFVEKANSTDSKIILASSYEKTAHVYTHLGDIANAEKIMDKAITLQEEIVKECTNKTNQNNLLIYYLDYCSLFLQSEETGISQKRDRMADKAVALGEHLAAELGTLDSLMRLLSVYHRKWSIDMSKNSYDEKAASIQWLMKWEEALKHLPEFTDRQQELNEQEYRLKWAYGDYYRCLCDKENLEKSISYYKQCESLIQTFDELLAKKRLAEYYSVMADNFSALGGAENIKAVGDYLEDHLNMRRELYRMTGLPLEVNSLRVALRKYANYCRNEKNQLEAAVALYEESICLAQKYVLRNADLENRAEALQSPDSQNRAEVHQKFDLENSTERIQNMTLDQKLDMTVDYIGLMDCYNAYRDAKQCEKSLSSGKQVQELLQTIKDEQNENALALKAKLLDRMARTYEIMGGRESTEKAISCCQEMIAIFEHLYEKQKTSHTLESLSVGYEKLGSFYLSLEDHISLKKAERAFTTYFEIREKVWKDLQTNSAYRNLAVAYEKKASIFRAYGGDSHYMTALELYKKALFIWEELYQKNQNFDSLDGIAIICHRVGEMYHWISKEGHKQLALTYFEREAKIREELVTLHPSDAYKNHLLSAYEKIGDIYKSLDGKENDRKALEIFNNLLKERMALHESMQSTSSYRAIAIAYERLGDVHYNMFTDEGYLIAKDYLKQAWNIWNEIKDQITVVDYNRGIYNTAKRIGNCCYHHSASSFKEEAVTYYGQMVNAGENLVKEVGTELWILRLAQAYSNLGVAYESRRDADGRALAKESYLQAEHWYEKLQIVSYIKEGTDLWSTALFKMAALFLAEGTAESLSMAKQYFLKGIQVCKRHPEDCSSVNGRYNQAAAHLQLGNLCVQSQEEDSKKEAVEYLEEAADLFEVLCEEVRDVNKLDNYWMCMYLLARNDYYEKSKLELVQKMLPIAEELFERTGNERHKGFVDFCKHVLKE